MSRRACIWCIAPVVLAVCATTASAQFGNVVFPARGHNPSAVKGFGNFVFPVTGVPKAHPFSISDFAFGSRLSGIVSGFNPYIGVGKHRGASYVYVPYAYPVYAPAPAYPQQPNVVVIYPPQQPPVVINQNFTSPQPAEPPAAEAPPAPEEPGGAVSTYRAPASTPVETEAAGTSYYLLAFKDNSIYSAVAYWVDGDTLHYFTSGNRHNQASLSLLDRELTIRLNRERGSDIRLP